MSAKIIAAIAAAAAQIETLTAKLAAATEKHTLLTAELATIEAVKDVGVGNLVIIAVGRGDTRRNVEAIVRAAKHEADENGHRTLKVEYTGAFTPGFEGVIKFTPDAFSNEFSVISTSSIVSVVKNEVPETFVVNESEEDLDAQIARANALSVNE